MHEVQSLCSSQKKLNLFFGDACSVKRAFTFFHVPSSVPCVADATYVHFDGSSAFTLTKLGAVLRLPWYRTALKNQRRSFMIGPPTAPFVSQILSSSDGAGNPAAFSESF